MIGATLDRLAPTHCMPIAETDIRATIHIPLTIHRASHLPQNGRESSTPTLRDVDEVEIHRTLVLLFGEYGLWTGSFAMGTSGVDLRIHSTHSVGLRDRVGMSGDGRGQHRSLAVRGAEVGRHRRGDEINGACVNCKYRDCSEKHHNIATVHERGIASTLLRRLLCNSGLFAWRHRFSTTAKSDRDGLNKVQFPVGFSNVPQNCKSCIRLED